MDRTRRTAEWYSVADLYRAVEGKTWRPPAPDSALGGLRRRCGEKTSTPSLFAMWGKRGAHTAGSPAASRGAATKAVDGTTTPAGTARGSESAAITARHTGRAAPWGKAFDLRLRRSRLKTSRDSDGALAQVVTDEPASAVAPPTGSAASPMEVFGGRRIPRMEKPMDQVLGRAVTLEEVARQHPDASPRPHTQWPPETRLTYFGRSTGDFTLRDAWTLRKGGWLQGIVIDCYIRAQASSRATVPFFHFNNTFYAKLRSKPRDPRGICLGAVRMWGLGQDWKDLALLTFVVPIPGHWTLIVADLRTSPKTLSAYDSLYRMNKDASIRMGYIQHYLRDLAQRCGLAGWTDWKMLQAEQPRRQQNSNDCGVAVGAMAARLLRGETLSSLDPATLVREYREQMLREILAEGYRLHREEDSSRNRPMIRARATPTLGPQTPTIDIRSAQEDVLGDTGAGGAESESDDGESPAEAESLTGVGALAMARHARMEQPQMTTPIPPRASGREEETDAVDSSIPAGAGEDAMTDANATQVSVATPATTLSEEEEDPDATSESDGRTPSGHDSEDSDRALGFMNGEPEAEEGPRLREGVAPSLPPTPPPAPQAEGEFRIHGKVESIVF